MAKAQQYVLLALTMRRDGIQSIANNIQSAMTKSTSKDRVQHIQQGPRTSTARTSSTRITPFRRSPSALKNAGLSIGPTTIYGGQVLHDLVWLDVHGIATKLGADLCRASAANSAPRPARTRPHLGRQPVGNNHPCRRA